MKLKVRTKKRHLWSLFLQRTKKEPNVGSFMCYMKMLLRAVLIRIRTKGLTIS